MRSEIDGQYIGGVENADPSYVKLVEESGIDFIINANNEGKLRPFDPPNSFGCFEPDPDSTGAIWKLPCDDWTNLDQRFRLTDFNQSSQPLLSEETIVGNPESMSGQSFVLVKYNTAPSKCLKLSPGVGSSECDGSHT